MLGTEPPPGNCIRPPTPGHSWYKAGFPEPDWYSWSLNAFSIGTMTHGIHTIMAATATMSIPCAARTLDLGRGSSRRT